MSASAGQANASLSQQILNYVSYPFNSCFPSSSNSYERQGLLDEASYDDSDAISLLSNIADRSRRRTRSARRREEWNRRAATLGCGLFGRPKGQIQQREVTRGDRLRTQQHNRLDSQDRIRGIGIESDDEEGEAPRSLISSFGDVQESGDEDAGMLGDEDIAEISTSKDEEIPKQQAIPIVHISEALEDHAAKSLEDREAQENAAIKERLEREAEEYAKAQEEDAKRLAAEEAALAAEEEEAAAAAAAIAKAKRKAERRAVKEGMMKFREETQRVRRRTEADAEAAAGGFDFAEEAIVSPHYHKEEMYGYENEEEYQSPKLQQPEIVHHHHYYHEPNPEVGEDDNYDDSLLSPNFRVQEMPTFLPQEQQVQEEAVEEDEDDADIAGIGFSKKKRNRSRGEGGSNTYSAGGRSNGSGSGSWQSGSADDRILSRYEAHRRGSDNSTQRDSAGQNSSAGKKSYRDRPRRHEKTLSRSTGSGAGSATMREGLSSRMRAVSPLRDQLGDEQRADAAAGGFDDFVPPPPNYKAGERRSNGDSGSGSSQGQRGERRREDRFYAPRNSLDSQDHRVDADIF